jgi:hypothetical protein
LESELAAIEERLALALHWTRNPITMETDYSNLSSHARRISVIIERMRERKTRVMKVSREANCASHGLAQLGRVDGRTAVWLRSFPPEIAAAINSDCTHPVI